jgi:hypothetical protein
LTILDAHTETPKVFWNGATVPAIDVGITNNYVVLTVLQSAAIPADLESIPTVRIRRRAQ